VIAPCERAARPLETRARWRVLVGPCPLGRERVLALRSALRRVQDGQGDRGDQDRFELLEPEGDADAARWPGELAAGIVAALVAGERVLLANGPWELGSTLGDPYVARAISLLPDELGPGVVVGAFHHGHVLTELALRAPAVAAYVAPPLAESLLAGAGGGDAAGAWRVMCLLGLPGERLCEVPRRAHVGYARPPLGARPARLPPCRELAPRTLRAGGARGRILAGSLLPVSFAIGRWSAHLDGAILALEVAGAQLRMIDRYLQRLALLGVFDRIGALLIGAPFDLVAERPSLDLDEIVLRAIGARPCAVVADAFVGSGLPGTCLRLGGTASVDAWRGGWRLAACAPAERSAPAARSESPAAASIEPPAARAERAAGSAARTRVRSASGSG
jgi:LD-carboxypeptidase C-terminal domain